MVWLMIPNITQLLEFDSLELHFFRYILCIYCSRVLVYLYSMRAELHFHSGGSLVFTDKFTILVMVFKCVVLRNYWSDHFQTYSIYY